MFSKIVLPSSLCLMIFFLSAPLMSNEQNARKTPDWVIGGIMYQINPRAFTEEGTLPAATARIPELARLGVTVVYLCPVFVSDDDMRQEFWSPRQKHSKMDNPRNPYRMKDYDNVDPEYGTNDDLRNFIKTSHEHGIRVLLDMVYLHCGPAAVFIEEHPDFVKRDAEGKIAVGESWPFPRLNFDRFELREYLWKNLEYWVREFDVDGFRMDVADGIPLDFWEESRRRIEKIRPDLAMLAEGSNPANQVFAFDMNYGFPVFPGIRDVMDATKPASDLVRVKNEQLDRQPQGGRFIHYTDNHDISNDDYENRREHRWGKAGNEAALVACFTFDGVPMLYNGQEIADKSRHSIFGKLPIDWSQAGTPEARDRFAFCQRMIALRKNHHALQASGKIRFVENDNPEAILSFERSLGGEKILVVINMRNKPVTAKVNSDFAPFEPLEAKGICATNENNPSFELPAYGWFIGKVKP